MPEAPVDEDDRVPLRQDQVGAPWQVLRVKPVAEALAVKRLPEDEFGLGVSAANSRHHVRPDMWRNDIQMLFSFTNWTGPGMYPERKGVGILMQEPIDIVDLFSGPGGLGEGFAQVRCEDGNRRFRINVSIECDPSAHRTLRLRAFLRLFPSPPPEYLIWINEGTVQPDWQRLYPTQWRAAEDEARCMRLGEASTTDFLSDRIRHLRSKVGHRSVLIGGPPCQAYSLVGRARNRGTAGYTPELDHRNFLYEEYVRILRELEPDVFVMENVKGMLSASVAGKRIFQNVQADLEDSGYRLVALTRGGQEEIDRSGAQLKPADFVIRAEDHGVPQARHRVIIVGIRKSAHAPEYLPYLSRGKQQATVRHVLGAIGGLRSGLSRKDDAGSWKEAVQNACHRVRFAANAMDDRVAERFRDLLLRVESRTDTLAARGRTGREPSLVSDDCPPALAAWMTAPAISRLPNMETRGHMPEDLGRYLFAAIFAEVHGHSPKAGNFPSTLAPRHANWKSGKFADRFRVQTFDSPSSTITSHISKDGHYFIHPDPTQCRSLTVREAARLQTFPDDYVFLGNRTEQFVQVGNAVPPFLAFQIAKEISAIFDRGVTRVTDPAGEERQDCLEGTVGG